MKENIISHIKSLPPLPKSVLEIQRITADENSSISDLVKVIKQDPLLTANLLKVANSPLYGFTREIKSIDQVVSLFGMSTIKGFAISFAVRNSMKFDLSAYKIDENRFHTISTKRNALVVNWFKRDRNRLDVLATDSFLIDIGAVVISLVLISENKADLFASKLNKDNREEVEKEFVGATTEEITAEIFRHWRFSNDLIETIENINNPQGRYKVESAALLVAKTLYDLITDGDKDKAVKIAKEYDLDYVGLKDSIKVVESI